MTAAYRPSDELAQLLQLTLDGALAPQDHQRLEELLRLDADAREFFVEFLRVHALLQDQAVAMCFSGEPTTDSGETSAVSAPKEAPTQQGSVAASAGAAWRLTLFIPWALAATLLLMLMLPKADRPEPPSPEPTGVVASSQPASQPSRRIATPVSQKINRPPAPVASLAAHDNATWKGAPLAIGQPLYEGEAIDLEKGKARISVGYGAEIVASGPCSLTFLANDRVQLRDGAIVVDVAEWARGFTVVTDNMDVVDLGTTFSVTAKAGLTAETAVLKGMVRALPATTRDGERRSVLLSEGEGLAVDDSGNRKSFKYTPDNRPSEFDSKQFQPYRPVQLNNTGFGLAEGDEDPYWSIVAGPQDAFSRPDYAQVCIPYKRYLDNDPSESQWVSIRDWETAQPNSVYTFATSFYLEGFDLSTMRLFGRFLADNGIKAVRVNGKAVKVESWADNVYGQRFDGQQFRFVNVTDGLVEGRNTIEVDVFNGTMVSPIDGEPNIKPNHMALRVEWYAFGRQSSIIDDRGIGMADEQKTRRSNKLSDGNLPRLAAPELEP